MKITLTQFRPNTAEAVWTDCFAQAIAELHKAGGGVLTVPTGEYSTGPIELCSNMELHLEPGAVIRFLNDPAAFPLQECQYEGRISHRPKPCLSAFNAENVALTGSGVLDGCGAPWWAAQRARTLANGRPYLLHFENVTHLRVCGVQLRNSPAWNIHPVLCEHVDALCLSIEGPKNSHNTDGFDPESCGFVRILGCQFSVGDDCIAIKSGKLGIEPELRPATHDVLISHCYMHDGHGAVVLGSEAAGGIKDLTVSKCLFERTDRGLRVKTRRGRGKDAVNEGITFEHIRMDEVLTPFVVNSFYFCDKDGKTDYVQSREALPVDDRTPGFGATTFCDIEATNCHAAAAYITGLPESKVTRLTFQDVHVTFAPDAEPFVPAMACGVEPMVRQGIIAQNVKVLDLQNVVIEGQDGEELQLQNVDKVIRA